MYEGVIIKETLTDELLLDLLKIEKTEIWKTSDKDIKYWTMIFFYSSEINFPERLSEVMIAGWFADFKRENIKYIVFKDCVYKYEIGNTKEKEDVLTAMRKRGIPDEQFEWEE